MPATMAKLVVAASATNLPNMVPCRIEKGRRRREKKGMEIGYMSAPIHRP